MTKSHQLHRKPAVHRLVRRSRRVWRLYWKVNRLFVQIGFDYEKHAEPEGDDQ